MLSKQATKLLVYIVHRIAQGIIQPDQPRSFLTYKSIHDDLGLELYGPTYGLSLLNHGLTELVTMLRDIGLPAISSLIVNQDTHLPGDDFFRFHRRRTDDYEWWLSQARASIEHDWNDVIRTYTIQIPEYIHVNSEETGTWREAVLSAVRRQVEKHNTPIVTRQQLIDEELETITSDISSKGITPEQTLSRTLQELRDDKQLYFFGGGSYLLLDHPIDLDKVDLPDDAIDAAIEEGKLRLQNVHTSDEHVLARRRKGQARIRQLTLNNYGHQCALCDIDDDSLLVASHIVRWADDSEARGDLSNIICLCRFHDPLFELGYIYLTDTYDVIKKPILNNTINLNLSVVTGFRPPRDFTPSPAYLQRHRQRTSNNPLP